MSSLIAIENLSFAEIKDRREELVKEAANTPASELAARYVQARQDAKQRDEKLAEQGRTIDALTQGLAATTEKAAALEVEFKSLGEKFVAQDQDWRKALADKDATHAEVAANVSAALTKQDATITELRAALAAETTRANRLKAEACRNNAALSGAAKMLNDALAAQRLDDAGA